MMLDFAHGSTMASNASHRSKGVRSDLTGIQILTEQAIPAHMVVSKQQDPIDLEVMCL